MAGQKENKTYKEITDTKKAGWMERLNRQTDRWTEKRQREKRNRKKN